MDYSNLTEAELLKRRDALLSPISNELSPEMNIVLGFTIGRVCQMNKVDDLIEILKMQAEIFKHQDKAQDEWAEEIDE